MFFLLFFFFFKDRSKKRTGNRRIPWSDTFYSSCFLLHVSDMRRLKQLLFRVVFLLCSFQAPCGKRKIISLSEFILYYNLEVLYKNLRHPLELNIIKHCLLPFLKPKSWVCFRCLGFFFQNGERCNENLKSIGKAKENGWLEVQICTSIENFKVLHFLHSTLGQRTEISVFAAERESFKKNQFIIHFWAE